SRLSDRRPPTQGHPLLVKRTPLQRRTRLQARSSTRPAPERPAAPRLDPDAARRALTRQRDYLAAPRPLFEGPVADPVRPKPGPDGSFTPIVRQTILDRDHASCMRCGVGIDGPLGYSLQHR